ncbi:MAG: glycosyltransferase family 39 protein [Eubacterium sp.]|nr:glycosyltransferase family 39 protein [Eubacterium sp.]
MEHLKNNRLNKIFDILVQLEIAMIFPVMFQVAAIIRYGLPADGFKSYLFPGFFFAVFIVLLVSIFVVGIKAGVFRKKAKTNDLEDDSLSSKNRSSISTKIYFVILFLITLSMRIPMIGTKARWDAGEYFYRIGTACDEYNFHFKNFLEWFSISAHVNYAYSSINAIPQFIFPRDIGAVNIWQLIFTMFGIVCIYSIFRNVWKLSDARAFFGTLMISCVPIFYGLSAYDTPDYFLLLFFIYAIYFGSKKKYVLECAMIINLVLVKETSTLIICGFYGMRILYDFVTYKGKFGEKIKNVLRRSSFWIATVSGAVFFFFKKLNARDWSESTYNENALRLSYTYITIRMKQFLFTNFAWIVSFFIIISFIIIVVRYRKTRKPVMKRDGMASLLGIVGAMTLFGAFGVVFKISPHERYNTFFAVCLVMLMCILLDNVSKKWLFNTVAIVTAALMFIETFNTVDPVTRFWFDEVPIGGGKTMNYENVPEDRYFGDGGVTNYEYAWLDKAIDKMLDESGYNSDMNIYLPAYQMTPQSGVHLDGNSIYYRIGWNDDKGKRAYYTIGQPGVSNLMMYAVEDSRKFFPYKDLSYNGQIFRGRVSDKGIYFSVPYHKEDDSYCLNKLSAKYYIGDAKEVKALRGTLTYYDVVKKDSYKGGPSLYELFNEREEISEEDLAISNELLNGNYESVIAKAKELAEYRIGKTTAVAERDLHGRKKIQRLDSVFLNIFVKDKDGKQVLKMENTSVTVGKCGVIEVLDDALLNMSIGDKQEVEYVVPKNTLGLEKYADETLYVTLEPTDISCTFYIDLDENTQIRIYEEALRELWDYYESIYYKNLVYEQLENMDDISSESKAVVKNYDRVEKYYNDYFEKTGLDENTFLDKYVGVTQEQFEKAKMFYASVRKLLAKAHTDFSVEYKKCLQN